MYAFAVPIYAVCALTLCKTYFMCAFILACLCVCMYVCVRPNHLTIRMYLNSSITNLCAKEEAGVHHICIPKITYMQSNVRETQALLQSFATNLMMDRKPVKSYTVSQSQMPPPRP